MPAKSKREAHLFGMAAAYKSGKKKLADFPAGVRDKIKKLADSMSLEKLKDFTSIKEDGEAGAAGPGEGAATLDGVVGRSSFDYGNNPQNGNADQRKGSGEPMGGGTRKLTPEEQEMLDMSAQLSGGDGVKVIGYDDFRAKAIKESFAAPDKVKKAIDIHFGDFGKEAHLIIEKLPVINGLLDIKSINEALSSKYKVGQIQKVIDAVRNQSGS